ncbi:hypothetical protein QFZ73_003051 [Peribacillus sp. V2I11]|nr:hypothetical protein [Peribacillus sp. V2I11]
MPISFINPYITKPVSTSPPPFTPLYTLIYKTD